MPAVDDYFDDRFEWEIQKNEDNLAEHFLDFEFASRLFDSEAYTETFDHRFDYGEERWKCIGFVEGILITVVYTPRGARRRIITAWPSTTREQNEYREAYAPW
jgi:uncharacterized DUF497 family protein